MVTFEELVAKVMDEVERRGGLDEVMENPSGPGECTATALFTVSHLFDEEQFKLVFALGQFALASHVFGVHVPGPYAEESPDDGADD